MPQNKQSKTSATNSSEILRIFLMRLTWDLFISQICENGNLGKSEKHRETLTKIIYLLFAPTAAGEMGNFNLKTFCAVSAWSPGQLIKVCTQVGMSPQAPN